MLKIYLAGAIRDDHEEDIEWRKQLISSINAYWLNPLGGKSYNKDTKKWSFCGIDPVASVIVPHDFWQVDRADIIIFNFLALADKYPNIGTLCEFGRASARPSLKYSIVAKDYGGHSNQSMFKLHPFIEQNSSAIFGSVDECSNFLVRALPVLEGLRPNFVY